MHKPSCEMFMEIVAGEMSENNNGHATVQYK